MKTLTFKYLKLFLLAVAMINLTSCEIEIDDFYDDDNIGGSYYNKSQCEAGKGNTDKKHGTLHDCQCTHIDITECLQ